jgi:serine/threonine protein kinase/Tol biopolymer transport system component
MSLAAGTKLGPYEILVLIGAGGMGEVYRARDTRLGREVALKILPDRLANNPDRRARFETEARAASALNHPGIVTIHDIGNVDGVAYIVTEFIDGASLRQSRPEALRRQLDIAAQIAEALAAAHAARITHRDLKPENIMVTRDGRVKTLDFGLARQAASSPTEDTLTLVTTPGTILGTVGYMSPEQARGYAADARSDIFSLGAVMYELFSGHRAFEGHTPADVLSAILKSDPPELLSAIPAGVRQIVERCLEKDPARRFQSTQDLAFALRAVAGSSLTAVASPVIGEPPAAKTRWLWPVAAAVAAVLVLGIGFWRLATEPQSFDMSQFRLRPFATEDYAEGNPVWSSDGKSIAYIAELKQVWELRVKALDGSPPVALVAGNRLSQPSWSRDGSRLYYLTGLGARVFSVSRAGGEPTPVTDGGALAAALSPDGQTLASLMREESGGQQQRVLTLSSPPGAPGKRLAVFPGWAIQNRVAWSRDNNKLLIWLQVPSSVWLADVHSGEVKQIASPRGTIWLNFSWFPDNRRVAISWPREDTAEDRTDLWILDTVTGQRSLLIPSTEDAADPSVSPDGKAIAFQSGRIDFDLMEFPLDGSPPRPLVVTRQYEDSVVWSPVAPEYAYVSQDAIWLRHRNSTGLDSEPRLIVPASVFPGDVPFRLASPSFSPDGTRIAYVKGYRGNPNAQGWISPVNGGTPAPLGQFGGLVAGLTWSPDSQWIAFNWTPTPNAGFRLVKIRVGSAEPTPLADEACAFNPEWSPDSSRILCSKGGVLYTMLAKEGASPELLGKEYEPIATWSREMRYIYAIRDANGKRQLGKLDWKSGEFQPLSEIPAEWTINTPVGNAVRLSLSADGKSLATTVVKRIGDIWILEGFQPPRTLWQRLLRH